MKFTKKELSELTKPDPIFYKAIGGDETVKRILFDFYEIAFDDPIIGHFFQKSEKRNLREKQFSFLRRCFSGEDGMYMGQRPRNAHHYMVISNAEYDRREDLMEKCLRDDGFSEDHIRKWIAIEEAFRVQIVKSEPRPLYMKGVQTMWRTEPEAIEMEFASLCDHCSKEISLKDSAFIFGEDLWCQACVDERESSKTKNT